MTASDMQVKDGKLEGPFTQRDEAGRPTMEAFFRNGQLEGRLRMLAPDGSLERELSFARGQLHGPVTIYDRNGDRTVMAFDRGENVTSSSDPAHEHLNGQRSHLARWLDRLMQWWRQ